MAKINVVYASFGQGHKKAAQALAQTLNVDSQDILDFSFPGIKSVYSFSYRFVTEYALFIWKALFYLVGKPRFSFFTDKINSFLFLPFVKQIRANRPDIVITTHFFPAQVLAFLKKELNFKIITVITDLRVYPLWVNDSIDHYWAATQITHDDLISYGVSEEKITTGYVPLRKGFLTVPPEANLGEKFSLDDKPVMLIVSSSRGNIPFVEEIIEKLLEDYNVFLIYGSNKRLFKNLSKLSSARLKLFGWYEDIWELVSLASIIVTKPGGLTVFEGLYMKKFFIFTHYIPGQEEGNMKALVSKGVARYAPDKEQFLAAVDWFFKMADTVKNSYALEVKDMNKVFVTKLNEVLADGQNS
ncbi:MAG: hypothetical protein PHU64_00900 [Candidatus Omnitrophica bacterium]|nr:hypothetical protein [Candidatus Omnitrophota bacterium]MDD5430316.1 hypothetical protein [Candidatus Omnitrophota bacterium]